MHIASLLSNSSDGSHFSISPSDNGGNTFRWIPQTIQDAQGSRVSVMDKSKEDIYGLVQEVAQLQDKSSASIAVREKKIKLLLILLLSKNTQIQCAVIDGLCELCMGSYARENQDTIISSTVVDSIDGMQLVSALLKSERLAIQLASTRLVGALCVKNDNVKGVISTSSVIPSLIHLLQSENVDVQKNAGAAICCAVDDDLRNKNVVYRAGGMTVLNNILLKNSSTSNNCNNSGGSISSESAVLLAVVSCIGALVTGFPAAQNAARNLNMIPTLVSSVYSAPPSMLARLACCIAEIARDNQLNAKAIVSTGGLQAACYILNTYSSPPPHTPPHPELLFHALALLWCLCKDSPKRCSVARRISTVLLPTLQTLTLYTFCANVRAAATLALRTIEQA